MRIVVVEHLTLDGVMQSPDGLDSDTRDGFQRGGWAADDNDEVMDRWMGERMARGGEGGASCLVAGPTNTCSVTGTPSPTARTRRSSTTRRSTSRPRR